MAYTLEQLQQKLQEDKQKIEKQISALPDANKAFDTVAQLLAVLEKIHKNFNTLIVGPVIASDIEGYLQEIDAAIIFLSEIENRLLLDEIKKLKEHLNNLKNDKNSSIFLLESLRRIKKSLEIFQGELDKKKSNYKELLDEPTLEKFIEFRKRCVSSGQTIVDQLKAQSMLSSFCSNVSKAISALDKPFALTGISKDLEREILSLQTALKEILANQKFDPSNITYRYTAGEKIEDIVKTIEQLLTLIASNNSKDLSNDLSQLQSCQRKLSELLEFYYSEEKIKLIDSAISKYVEVTQYKLAIEQAKAKIAAEMKNAKVADKIIDKLSPFFSQITIALDIKLSVLDKTSTNYVESLAGLSKDFNKTATDVAEFLKQLSSKSSLIEQFSAMQSFESKSAEILGDSYQKQFNSYYDFWETLDPITAILEQFNYMQFHTLFYSDSASKKNLCSELKELDVFLKTQLKEITPNTEILDPSQKTFLRNFEAIAKVIKNLTKELPHKANLEKIVQCENELISLLSAIGYPAENIEKIKKVLLDCEQIKRCQEDIEKIKSSLDSEISLFVSNKKAQKNLYLSLLNCKNCLDDKLNELDKNSDTYATAIGDLKKDFENLEKCIRIFSDHYSYKAKFSLAENFSHIQTLEDELTKILDVNYKKKFANYYEAWQLFDLAPDLFKQLEGNPFIPSNFTFELKNLYLSLGEKLKKCTENSESSKFLPEAAFQNLETILKLIKLLLSDSKQNKPSDCESIIEKVEEQLNVLLSVYEYSTEDTQKVKEALSNYKKINQCRNEIALAKEKILAAKKNLNAGNTIQNKLQQAFNAIENKLNSSLESFEKNNQINVNSTLLDPKFHVAKKPITGIAADFKTVATNIENITKSLASEDSFVENSEKIKVCETALAAIPDSEYQRQFNCYTDFWNAIDPIAVAAKKLDAENPTHKNLQAELTRLHDFLNEKLKNVTEATPKALKDFEATANAVQALTVAISSNTEQNEKLKAVETFEKTLSELPLFKTDIDKNTSRKIIAGIIFASIGAALGVVLGAVLVAALYGALSGGVGAIPGAVQGAIHGGITGWTLGLMASSALFGAFNGGAVGAYAGVSLFKRRTPLTELAKVARKYAEAADSKKTTPEMRN